ncbi:uncharacterized protein V6R79_011513 [Siganus canaliculatus]
MKERLLHCIYDDPLKHCSPDQLAESSVLVAVCCCKELECPGLKSAPIREEFYRITNKNLMDNFKEALHQHTWRLLRLYRARRTAFSSEMNQILNSLDQETSDIAHRQTAALKGLPLYLRDSQEKLFRNCLDTDPEKDQTKGLTVGILTVLEDDDSRAPQSVKSFHRLMRLIFRRQKNRERKLRPMNILCSAPSAASQQIRPAILN